MAKIAQNGSKNIIAQNGSKNIIITIRIDC